MRFVAVSRRRGAGNRLRQFGKLRFSGNVNWSPCLFCEIPWGGIAGFGARAEAAFCFFGNPFVFFFWVRSERILFLEVRRVGSFGSRRIARRSAGEFPESRNSFSGMHFRA